MAHCLSQEQVLDIRARLFSNNGRVTVASVREALRVVGQDELSDEEILRLVGVNEASATSASKTSGGGGQAQSPAAKAKAAAKAEAKRKKKEKRRLTKQKAKTAVSYFLASSSSSSSDDEDAASSPGQTKIAIESFHDDYLFPSTVDFPQFLQRLNRVLQDRETIKELKQLFYVLARFAFERRQKDVAASFSSVASPTTKGGKQSQSQSQSQQQQQQQQVSNFEKEMLQNANQFVGPGADSEGLHAESERRELERFLQIRSAVDHDGGKNNAKPSAAAAKSPPGSPKSSHNNEPSSPTTKKNSAAAAAAAAAAASKSFYTNEELAQMCNPHVLTREELRVVMTEVLEACVRKSTGIDHVMAGLDEGENFISCERFVQLILRGGPEVVALPFLL